MDIVSTLWLRKYNWSDWFGSVHKTQQNRDRDDKAHFYSCSSFSSSSVCTCCTWIKVSSSLLCARCCCVFTVCRSADSSERDEAQPGEDPMSWKCHWKYKYSKDEVPCVVLSCHFTAKVVCFFRIQWTVLLPIHDPSLHCGLYQGSPNPGAGYWWRSIGTLVPGRSKK